MGALPGGDGRGILNPRAGEQHFTLARHAPAADLAGLVERYWTVRWDLRERAPFEQETLPFPYVNVVLGTHRPGVHGVCTTRFLARLDGEGWVIGIKFRPGGFRPFVSFAMSELTDRELPIGEVFGDAGARLDGDVHTAQDDRARIALVESFLRAHRPRLDADALETARVVDLVGTEPSIARVGDLASRAGRSVRALQRLFESHVGVSPKWVIRRFRIQEAAERIARGVAVDGSTLAHDLGYFDQAHFIRDFKAQVGRTPTDYTALCERAHAPGPRGVTPSPT